MNAERLRDRGLYLFLSVLMWGLALVGFWPGYVGPAVSGDLDKSGAVHFHVFIFVGWLVLFTVQATLPMLRRSRLHRKVGLFGIAYGLLLWIVGLHVTWSRFADRVRLGDLDAARFQTLPPLTDMIIFPVLFYLAVHYRDRPEIHKRFMVLTSTMLGVAAVARMTINGLLPENVLIFDLVWLSPVWFAIAHDALRERRLHPVYGFGALALSLVPLRMLLIDSGPWREIVSWAAAKVIL